MSSSQEVRYFSTRGGEEELSFEETVLRGLSPNGGLYLPTHIPQLPKDWESKWASLSYSELAFEIFSLYISPSSIPPNDLKELVNNSYSTFRHPLVTPLRQVGPSSYVLELFHGPTLAFKDVALQFLGNVFSYFLTKRNASRPSGQKNEELAILGATSGDTGSAAIAGVRGKANMSIFILYPDGKISPVQLAQMATITDDNVFVVAVADSDFDTCQTIAKQIFSDAEFKAKHMLGSVNSINWCRLLAQTVYYFHSYLQLPEPRKNVHFVVPTGNFGDIFAGYLAKRMGLPVDKLVCATNVNDVVEKLFTTGKYGKGQAPSPGQSKETQVVNGASDGQQSSSLVESTHSNAMDINLSSNVERVLYYFAEETGSGKRTDAQETVRKWYEDLKNTGIMDLGEEVKKVGARDFWAERVTDDETLEEIRRYYELPGPYGPYVIDPHTAVGLRAQSRSEKKASSDATWITLSTAHPAKFSSSVEDALDKKTYPNFDFRRDVLPEEVKRLEGLKTRVYKVKTEKDIRELIERVHAGEAVAEGATTSI